MIQTQNDVAESNSLIQTNNLTLLFQHHTNQFVKFHFLPCLKIPEREALRGTCQTIRNKILANYSYFETKPGGYRFPKYNVRIDTVIEHGINTGCIEILGGPKRRFRLDSVCPGLLQIDIKNIFSSHNAYAVLKKNGSIMTWGDPENGGDSSSVTYFLQSDVKTIFSTNSAFAALKTNGSVVTWGDSLDGGDSSYVRGQLSDVKTISSTDRAFAALTTNGRVITWGHSDYGGNSSKVYSHLQSGVKSIGSTDESFFALKTNGRVINWGLGGNKINFNSSDS